jgi:hypothetical protein
MFGFSPFATTAFSEIVGKQSVVVTLTGFQLDVIDDGVGVFADGSITVDPNDDVTVSGMDGRVVYIHEKATTGVAKMKAQMADANIDDRMIARQEAIISSMTKAERKKPDLLNASRKKRVAAGAGVEVQEINRLLKQHRQMADMVKSLSRGGRGNMQKMAAMMGGLGMGGMPGMGGAPSTDRLKALGGGRMPEPSPEEMKALQDRLAGLGGGQLPGGLPGLPVSRLELRPER